jgi:hypothetical protein
MANTKPTSSRKEGNEFGSDSQMIVEEKIVKVNGETTIRKYAKGRFLGKVAFYNLKLGRICPVL